MAPIRRRGPYKKYLKDPTLPLPRSTAWKRLQDEAKCTFMDQEAAVDVGPGPESNTDDSMDIQHRQEFSNDTYFEKDQTDSDEELSSLNSFGNSSYQAISSDDDAQSLQANLESNADIYRVQSLSVMIIKSLKKENQNLMHENNKLKQEIKHCKAMQSIETDFCSLLEQFRKLTKQVTCGMCEEKLSMKEKNSGINFQSAEDVERPLYTPLEDTLYQDHDDNFEIVEHKPEINSDMDASASPIFLQDKVKAKVKQQLSSSEGFRNKQESNDKQLLKEIRSELLHPQDKSSEVINFGSTAVAKCQVMRARHSKLTILAAELTALVFSAEEMALCTVKGKKTNAHKTAFKKSCLPGDRVQGIISYIASYFGKNINEIQDEVIKAIGCKLNNFTKTEVAKRIIAEHQGSIVAVSIEKPSQENMEKS